jgi:hypothetical protein
VHGRSDFTHGKTQSLLAIFFHARVYKCTLQQMSVYVTPRRTIFGKVGDGQLEPYLQEFWGPHLFDWYWIGYKMKTAWWRQCGSPPYRIRKGEALILHHNLILRIFKINGKAYPILRYNFKPFIPAKFHASMSTSWSPCNVHGRRSHAGAECGFPTC